VVNGKYLLVVVVCSSVAAKFKRLVYPWPSSPFLKYKSWYFTSYRLSTSRADKSANSKGPLPLSSPERTTCAVHFEFACAAAKTPSASANPSSVPGWPLFSPNGSFSPSAISCIFFGGLFWVSKGALSLRLIPTRDSITARPQFEPSNGVNAVARSACVAPHSAQKITDEHLPSASAASRGSTNTHFTSSSAGANMRCSTTSSGMSSGQYVFCASLFTTSTTFAPPYFFTARLATRRPVEVVAPATTTGASLVAVALVTTDARSTRAAMEK